ncbi:hypothetical protein JYU34_019765 [Plutella xylostella]|uniref:Uncharacterized protein n=1 Tax=Plutella xylostella TaxID=51655 RepID=A0ABQ7PV91_PLUXY|nr:hypothetical protein JYU34_019765 [Plutella xylostella]
MRQGLRQKVQPDAPRANSLRREATRVSTLQQGIQPAVHPRHTRAIPQRRAALRVWSVRARLRG